MGFVANQGTSFVLAIEASGLRPKEILNLPSLERQLLVQGAVELEKDRREFQANLTEALAEVWGA